jgi:hypothetical protein
MLDEIVDRTPQSFLVACTAGEPVLADHPAAPIKNVSMRPPMGGIVAHYWAPLLPSPNLELHRKRENLATVAHKPYANRPSIAGLLEIVPLIYPSRHGILRSIRGGSTKHRLNVPKVTRKSDTAKG